MKTLFIGLTLILFGTMVQAETVYTKDGEKLKIVKVVNETKILSLNELATLKVRANESLQKIESEYLINKQNLINEVAIIDLQIVEATKLGIIKLVEPVLIEK